ncbi:hypothetical protein P9314_13465 [Paenibacillus validus]|uniref:hypothetical protein n=1 Tax=Paenibacillus TaxID=44249 RepID=UPI000FDBC7E1|nr:MULTISPECIES: hypothetical protein [Paenibacillus]MED4601709.1 hypothetical protein [Paenibacillus validus]MED4608751.1 hypothetical protein [Paenibacillus validus]
MSKKLEKNGLWESSRMMLPQHKEAFQNRLNDKSVQHSRPTTEEINMMRDYVLLPIMHSIIIRKAREVERSSETLRLLYSKAAQVLAKNIHVDLSKVKKYLLEKNIRVFEEEKDDRMIRYRYICREHEDSFTITRDYMRAEISVRIGRYADSLVTNMYSAGRPDEQQI